MAHHCHCALITCEDFRLHQKKDGRNYLSDFIKTLDKDCDIITRGGAIQDLVRPKTPGFAESLLRDIEVSVKLHDIKILYLVNHTNCGAYGHFGFTDSNEEKNRHAQDLKAAKTKILGIYPHLEVKAMLFELQPETSDIYEIKEL